MKYMTSNPGCYIMKTGDEVIYVGKAKNLKNRLKSYFNSSNHTPKVSAMLEKVDDFEIILCSNNYEALTLECTLIKKYKPFYNILLKDDKQYPYIKIDLFEKFPRIQMVRKKDSSSSLFFGPFLSTKIIYQITSELNKIFQLRTCKIKFPTNKLIRPCIKYEIGSCKAPCYNLCTEEEYREGLENAIKFIKGKTSEIEISLKNKMIYYSNKLLFENAASVRDKLNLINEFKEKQLAVLNNNISQDVWAIYSNIKDSLIYKISIIEGKIIDTKFYILENYAKESQNETFSNFIAQYYSTAPIAKEILLSLEIDDKALLEEYLNKISKKKIKIIIPKRGVKKSLVDLCMKNAQSSLNKKELVSIANSNEIDILKSNLGICSDLNRIECFDISNTFGEYSVASMVVFNKGKPEKKSYRKFKIKSINTANDFQSMYEVIYRRFRRAIDEENDKKLKSSFSIIPDLIIVDGGVPQIKAATMALQELNFDIIVCGLAEKNEEIFLENRETPIILDDASPALHLIQRIRNEAHRFAISYHRNIRDKNMLYSDFLSIKGLGNTILKNLFIKYKTLENISTANINDLKKIKGINEQIAKEIIKVAKENKA